MSPYREDEVYRASCDYFEGNELAATTWMNKYSMRDSEGRFVERTPDDMHRRLACEFARKEAEHASRRRAAPLSPRANSLPLTSRHIYELLRGFRFVIPNGCVAAALGNHHAYGSLSNCVVLPPPYDSYGGILFADQQTVQLYKRRCGVGIDLTSLRPDGARTTNMTGASTGPVGFMERFSRSKREIAPNGRRGSLMLTLHCQHPDIERFIESKSVADRVTGANISVRVDDEFMRAVSADRDHCLRWPIESGQTATVERRMPARALWERLVRSAHGTAEPGILFWDRQHWYSPSSVYEAYRNVTTNPCGEVAMQGGDSCRLMTLNLFSFVTAPFSPQATFDFDLFGQVVYEAQRLCDDLVDLEIEAIDRLLAKVDRDPEPSHIKEVEVRLWQLLKEQGLRGRRTGLGLTALADTVAALGLRYGSDECLESIGRIMRAKCAAEFEASIDLAVERGPFEGFNPAVERDSLFVQMLESELPELHQRMMTHGRRNVSISTVPPAGSLSLLAGTSSGVEPVFRLEYTQRRRVKHDDAHRRVDFVDDTGDAWQTFAVRHPKLVMWAQVTGRPPGDGSPYDEATADAVSWERRLRVQAVVQKYTTHSISSTLNLSKATTIEDVDRIFRRAWDYGLKGVTVYREASRSGVLVDNTATTAQVACAVRGEAPDPLCPTCDG